MRCPLNSLLISPMSICSGLLADLESTINSLIDGDWKRLVHLEVTINNLCAPLFVYISKCQIINLSKIHLSTSMRITQLFKLCRVHLSVTRVAVWLICACKWESSCSSNKSGTTSWSLDTRKSWVTVFYKPLEIPDSYLSKGFSPAEKKAEE